MIRFTSPDLPISIVMCPASLPEEKGMKIREEKTILLAGKTDLKTTISFSREKFKYFRVWRRIYHWFWCKSCSWILLTRDSVIRPQRRLMVTCQLHVGVIKFTGLVQISNPSA